MTNKSEDGKGMARQETDPITDDCDGVLDFLQAVMVKAPKVAAAPLSLSAYKRARD